MENEIIDDISKINSGAILELIQLELDRVSENILDPNVKQEATREITLKLSFKPSVDARGNLQYVGMNAKCSSKLAAHIGVGSIVHVAQYQGKATLFAGNFEQPELIAEDKKVRAVK